MSNFKRPGFPGPDHRLPLQRGPGHPLGFIGTVQGKVAQLKREAAGLVDRLRYRYQEGEPAAFRGERVFLPSTDIVTSPLYPGEDLNVVVPDAHNFSVPITLPGPGVFMARFLNVEFYQRIFGGANNGIYTNRVYKYVIPQTRSPSTVVSGPQNQKFHLARGFSRFDVVAQQDRVALGANYFWNLVDTDSGRKVADDLVSSQVLLPQGFENEVDGGVFEFQVPWLFERSGILDFQFRLINPILQLDPGNAGAAPTVPFIFDDREDGGSVRNQAVTVRCELHGTKFITERDTYLRETV